MRARRPLITSLLVLTPLLLLGAGRPDRVPDPVQLPGGDTVRLILIGDTGQPPVVDDPHKMNAAQREALRGALVAEDADAILDLGDLFYEVGQKCGRRSLSEEDEAGLDRHLYDHVGGLQAPVILVLGNHDVGPYREYIKRKLFGVRHGQRSEARERCYEHYARAHDDMIFPAEHYEVRVGDLVQIQVLNTSAPLRDWPDAIDPVAPWQIYAGHHVLQTAGDKESEDIVRPWLERQEHTPDLWANGHAHFLQFGVFDGIPAATSGSGSKLREHPACPEDPNCAVRGVDWGVSQFGYAVVDMDATTMTLTFKTHDGQDLWSWEQSK